MKKRLTVGLCACLTLCLLLTGCASATPKTPQERVYQALAALENAKSFEMECNLVTDYYPAIDEGESIDHSQHLGRETSLTTNRVIFAPYQLQRHVYTGGGYYITLEVPPARTSDFVFFHSGDTVERFARGNENPFDYATFTAKEYFHGVQANIVKGKEIDWSKIFTSIEKRDNQRIDDVEMEVYAATFHLRTMNDLLTSIHEDEARVNLQILTLFEQIFIKITRVLTYQEEMGVTLFIPVGEKHVARMELDVNDYILRDINMLSLPTTGKAAKQTEATYTITIKDFNKVTPLVRPTDLSTTPAP